MNSSEKTKIKKQILCNNCKHSNPSNVKFCDMCGKEISNEQLIRTDISDGYLVFNDDYKIKILEPKKIIGRIDFIRKIDPEKAAYLSRNHIIVWREDSNYYLIDESSDNKTYINGQNITGKGNQILQNGDTINLGNVVKVKFQLL